jgi:hypothetical protein
MEFGDFPEKPKNDEKPKRRFFTRRRLLVWLNIVALSSLLLYLVSEFWIKPIFQAMVISCTF